MKNPFLIIALLLGASNASQAAIRCVGFDVKSPSVKISVLVDGNPLKIGMHEPDSNSSGYSEMLAKMIFDKKVVSVYQTSMGTTVATFVRGSQGLPAGVNATLTVDSSEIGRKSVSRQIYLNCKGELPAVYR